MGLLWKENLCIVQKNHKIVSNSSYKYRIVERDYGDGITTFTPQYSSYEVGYVDSDFRWCDITYAGYDTNSENIYTAKRLIRIHKIQHNQFVSVKFHKIN